MKMAIEESLAPNQINMIKRIQIKGSDDIKASN